MVSVAQNDPNGTIHPEGRSVLIWQSDQSVSGCLQPAEGEREADGIFNLAGEGLVQHAVRQVLGRVCAFPDGHERA